MSKLILGLVGILGVFTAQAVTPEGKPLGCVSGASPVPITGFRPPSLGRIEMKAKIGASSASSPALFCARKGISDSSKRFAFGLFMNPSKWYFHYKDAICQPADRAEKYNRQLVVSVSAKDGLVVNGQQVPGSAVAEQDFEVGGDLVLFAAPNVSGSGYTSQADFTFYWAKVYDAENNLIASFIPWMGKDALSNDAAGVLDEKTGRFYLPEGSPLNWIEESGHRLSWCATKDYNTLVDTGFVPPSRGRIEAKFAFTPETWPDRNVAPFGARKNVTDMAERRSFALILRGKEGYLDFHYNQSFQALDDALVMPCRELVVSVSAKDGILINGQFVEGSAVGAADFTVGGSLTIFGVSGVSSVMRLYGLKVFDEDEKLLASYVPWVDESGVVGVCDELTGLCCLPSNGTLYAGRTISAEMTGPKTAKVKVSAMPDGIRVLESDRYLWTACDCEDKGEDLSKWTYKSEPVAIPSDACEVEVTFPKQYKGVNRFGRVFIAAPDSLTGTGQQYVELDRPLTQDDGVEMVVSSADSQQKACLFGSRSSAAGQNVSALLNQAALAVDFNNSSYTPTRVNANLAVTGVYRIVDDRNHRVVTDLTTGQEIGKNEKVCSDRITQPGNCRIFGMSSGAPSGYGGFVGSVYSFKVYETATGKTLYNLVPGRNADGEACFVDSLTGKTYENKGTETFISSSVFTSASVALPPLKRQGLVIFFSSALRL